MLVDSSLSRSQQTVQACHAVIEFALKYGPEWKHQSLVVLRMKNADEIDEWYLALNTIHKDKCRSVAFFESHWDNRLTAIAVHGGDDLFTDIPLL